MKRFSQALLATAVALCGLACAPAGATVIIYNLTAFGNTDYFNTNGAVITSSSIIGTVQIDDHLTGAIGAGVSNTVDFQVNLLGATKNGVFYPATFVDTGDGHSTFTYNIKNAPAVSVTNITSGFGVVPPTAPVANNPFGSFSNAITCAIGGLTPACKTGASSSTRSVLNFQVTGNGLSDASFVRNGPNNTSGYIFAADIFFQGVTGAIASDGTVASNGTSGGRVPEPASSVLIGLGLLALAARRRLRRKHPLA